MNEHQLRTFHLIRDNLRHTHQQLLTLCDALELAGNEKLAERLNALAGPLMTDARAIEQNVSNILREGQAEAAEGVGKILDALVRRTER